MPESDALERQVAIADFEVVSALLVVMHYTIQLNAQKQKKKEGREEGIIPECSHHGVYLSLRVAQHSNEQYLIYGQKSA